MRATSSGDASPATRPTGTTQSTLTPSKLPRPMSTTQCITPEHAPACPTPECTVAMPEPANPKCDESEFSRPDCTTPDWTPPECTTQPNTPPPRRRTRRMSVITAPPVRHRSLSPCTLPRDARRTRSPPPTPFVSPEIVPTLRRMVTGMQDLMHRETEFEKYRLDDSDDESGSPLPPLRRTWSHLGVTPTRRAPRT